MQTRKLSIVMVCLVIAGALAPAKADGLRWRYKEFAPQTPSTGTFLTKVNNVGQIQVNVIGTNQMMGYSGILESDGAFTISPNLGQYPIVATGITESGRLYGAHAAQSVAMWDPVSGFTVHDIGGPLSGLLMNSSGNGAYHYDGYPPPYQFFESLRNDGRIEYLGWGSGEVADMNEDGYVAMYIFDQPLLLSPDGVTIRALSQTAGRALGVNNNGEVFGVTTRQGSNPGTYGVWWDLQGNVIRERLLYNDGNGNNYTSQDRFRCQLNDLGEITYTVGWNNDNLRSKFYSPLLGEIDISDNVEGLPSGSKITGIRGMNNSRMMTGALLRPGGPNGLYYSYNFYLEPVPEPATLVALGVGVAALLRRRRKGR